MKLDHPIIIETCPGVYAPAEDTYHLLSAVEAREGQRVLEMGCGTGIIAMHCAKNGCQVTAADIFPDAVENARMNAAMNSLDVKVIQSDLFQNVEGKFDIIIFNPPYLSAQDAGALSEAEKRPLVGGKNGHEVTARFLEEATCHLSPGGKIYLLTSSESEAGVLEKASQKFSVRKIAEERIFFETLAVYELRLVI